MDEKFRFINGDSIEVLKSIKKKVDLIYLDPPFCSGRDYKFSALDKEAKFKDTWKKGEYEIWLEELIIKCKKKLNKTGNLFFHISSELSFIPLKILNKYFKFIDIIYWKKAHGKNTVKKKLGSVIDLIIKCSFENSKFNLEYVPLNEKYFQNSYKNKDEKGFYALGALKHDKSRKGYFYEIKKNNKSYSAPYGWKIKKEKMLELIDKNLIHYANGNKAPMLYKKLYKHDCKGKPLSNLWDDLSYITRTNKDKRVYPTQKPLELLKRIIKISTDKNDLVLDPCAGSGTTGIAALELKRKVILIDINKECETIFKKRLSINLNGFI